jgi:hypothetical protein
MSTTFCVFRYSPFPIPLLFVLTNYLFQVICNKDNDNYDNSDDDNDEKWKGGGKEDDREGRVRHFFIIIFSYLTNTLTTTMTGWSVSSDEEGDDPGTLNTATTVMMTMAPAPHAVTLPPH